ncbi:MAG TPA: hypothetical protein VNS58_05850 [Puia sp.]|nr:hypothetical protein [Puia sp.]
MYSFVITKPHIVLNGSMNAELSGASLNVQLQILQRLNRYPAMDKSLLRIVLRSFRELVEAE